MNVKKYTLQQMNDIILREIAFCSLGDDTVRQVALWFSIPSHEIAESAP